MDLAGELRQLFRFDFSGNRAILSDDFRQHVSVEAARAKELVYETISHKATSRKRMGTGYLRAEFDQAIIVGSEDMKPVPGASSAGKAHEE